EPIVRVWSGRLRPQAGHPLGSVDCMTRSHQRYFWDNPRRRKSPMSNDDNFEPYWLGEDDWLVTVCPLPKDEDDSEVNLETLNWIGRLFGFATATNTRVVALVGDPGLPAYEILLSFDCKENHEEFLRLVEADGYADASDFMVPS